MCSGSHTLLFVFLSKKYHLCWLLDHTHNHPSGRLILGCTAWFCSCTVMFCCCNSEFELALATGAGASSTCLFEGADTCLLGGAGLDMAGFCDVCLWCSCTCACCECECALTCECRLGGAGGFCIGGDEEGFLLGGGGRDGGGGGCGDEVADDLCCSSCFSGYFAVFSVLSVGKIFLRLSSPALRGGPVALFFFVERRFESTDLPSEDGDVGLLPVNTASPSPSIADSE